MKVGIDAMGLHSPEHYIDMGELALSRNVDPDKYLKGLGQKKMAVATPCEDTVTLAASAGAKALKNFDIDPESIGTLVVGTETGVDHSKPVAVYVHQALGLRSNCRTYETKHACFGAMAGVFSACDWIASKRGKGSKALVIASDIARYGVGSEGEPTQGAGAVAMVISKSPRLVYFSSRISGDYTNQVMDFWRPIYSKFAFVDGHYSIDCYLDALEAAWKDAMDKAKDPERFSINNLQATLYHVPFVKMARKAHFRHWESQVGQAIGDGHALYPEMLQSFSKRVSPWLSLNSIIGNIYTGSLFLSLMDFLRQEAPEVHQPISLFSYGSGCAATYSIAYPVKGFSRFRKLLDPADELDRRKKLTIEQYEEIARFSSSMDNEQWKDKTLNPDECNLQGEYLYLGNKNHIRQYSGIE